ncbi:(Na+)-NQR maturation NqrM [Celerinatantimonas sp. MCCC 1A17872]|uniref:(Na+)-NQR maturation NqrM n=1 Tax=Celerinatantimonas sp. MCCC 1A17872 TaxID=3177514 RepID=UPI0038C0EB0F
MTYFLITFAVFLVIIAAMSVGYIIQRKTISGSCGGIAALGLEKVCDCPEPCEKRKAKMAKEKRLAQIREENRII